MAKSIDTLEFTTITPKGRFRYVCHGCTKNAGYFQTPAENLIVICPHCGMEQLSKLENFIVD